MKSEIVGVLIGACLMFSGCFEGERPQKLRFALSPEYPPFEYKEKGELVGFDVALAKEIAKELGKEAEFLELPFSAVFVAVQNGMADLAISTITITQDREKNFDFSAPYYQESMAIIFQKEAAISSISQLSSQKIACQLGSTMEIWLREHVPEAEIFTTDTNPQGIEALKAGQVDGVLIDLVQANVFCQKNPSLHYQTIATADRGYGVLLPKGSKLKAEVNQALGVLREQGVIQQLIAEYVVADKW